MSESIIPGAVTVAVTSGKGGVGKTTTATALAAALAARGLDVVLLDGDLAGPNAHLVADVTEVALGVEKDQLKLRLPASPLGFRLVTPLSVTAAEPRARVAGTDLIGMAQFADPAQVVIVDLPPGWTKEHQLFCHLLPDLVVAVTAPTETAISDHRIHQDAWTSEWASAVQRRKDADRRRKVTLPAEPTVVSVETMARFTGIPDGGDTPVTIRRVDAVPAARVAELVAPVVSFPATATVSDTAATPEVGKLADMVSGLLPV